MTNNEPALDTLIDILRTGNITAALNAMDFLEAMGNDATPALEQVKEVLLYSHAKIQVFEIRVSAARLLEKLSNK